MKIISREKVSYRFDPTIFAVGSAKIGESVVFQTRDRFNDEIHSEKDLATSMDMSHMNPCTGPLYVTDAKPGDILAVRIEDIKLRRWGVLALIPNEGILNPFVTSPLTKLVAINQDKDYVEYESNIRLKLRPHIGTMATCPNIPIPTTGSGVHGGNMDINRLGPGSVIYFPVFVEGAMLSMGNIHANMGDAETCIAVETGAEVQVCIDNIYHGIHLPAPIIETEDSWITYSDSPSGEKGVLDVSRWMAAFLCSRTGISMEDAALLIGTTGDVHIGQCGEAGYNHTFYLEFPKDAFTDGSLESFDSDL